MALVSKISVATLEKMKKKSILSKPSNLSARGVTADQVKASLTSSIFDNANSIVAEFNRLVDEINEYMLSKSSASETYVSNTTYNGLVSTVNNLGGLIAQLNTDLGTLNTALAGKQTIANLYDGLDSSDPTKYLSAKQGKILKDLVDKKNKGINYNSISTMVTDLNSADNSILSVGDNIYILDVNVPDFWIKDVKETSSPYTFTTFSAFMNALNTNNYLQIGYYEIAKLETEKVDLSGYQPKGSFDVDSTTTIVSHTYNLNEEKTYSASGISSISINIPSGVDVGFFSGANFKVGSEVPLFAIVNNSSFPLKIIHLGVPIESFTPRVNTTITTLIYNDGLNTYLQINEVA